MILTLKRARVFLWLILVLTIQSTSAKYIIINRETNQKCQGDFCTESLTIKDSDISNFEIKALGNKDGQAKNFQIQLNKARAQVTILDQQNKSGFIALLKVSPAVNKSPSLYAVYATSGSAGRYYHYFSVQAHKTQYLGLMAELIALKDGSYISHESDGPRQITSYWQWKKNQMVLVKEEVTP